MVGKLTKQEDIEVQMGARGLLVGRLHLGSGKRSAFRYDGARQ